MFDFLSALAEPNSGLHLNWALLLSCVACCDGYRFVEQLPVQKIADVVQCLLGSLQERNVGRKDMDHALPSMHLDRATLPFEPLPVPDGVVKENVVLTH